ncbi:hypothetical protein CEXT_298001 [Caerostris extrusa]|uniref:Uncharacterized protein n=1 Tax=Caerostris extrusa TaxID=172846 RepID=A0AAV4XSQ0_CAEEX|nr:hypothetical protein CEXT_298001 [Caerostris extrusa]
MQSDFGSTPMTVLQFEFKENLFNWWMGLKAEYPDLDRLWNLQDFSSATPRFFQEEEDRAFSLSNPSPEECAKPPIRNEATHSPKRVSGREKEKRN